MRHVTLNFNRQVIRLCKGILKAWEEWVNETEYEDARKIQEKVHSVEKLSFKEKEKEPDDKFVNS
jgi:hypothetical protein